MWFSHVRKITEEDDKFIQKTLAGDAEAYGQLYEKYVERIYRFLYFKTPSIQVAEDMTQATFTKAFEKLKSYRSGSFQAWLYMIAHNTARDYWRGLQRHGEVPLNPDTQIIDSVDMAEQLDTKWTVARLKQQIKALPSPYKEVVALRFIGDLAIGEVAQVLGKSEGWVRVVSHRGLQMLRKKFGHAL